MKLMNQVSAAVFVTALMFLTANGAFAVDGIDKLKKTPMSAWDYGLFLLDKRIDGANWGGHRWEEQTASRGISYQASSKRFVVSILMTPPEGVKEEDLYKSCSYHFDRVRELFLVSHKTGKPYLGDQSFLIESFNHAKKVFSEKEWQALARRFDKTTWIEVMNPEMATPLCEGPLLANSFVRNPYKPNHQNDRPKRVKLLLDSY